MSKRALLVGCNYPGTSATLRGCINDVKSMYGLLTECYGFAPQNISVLVDDGTSKESPTGANIKKYLSGMVSVSQPGDIAVFHFSGHGTQVTDKDGGEEDNKDEAIVPTDMNLICDDDLRLILGPMAQGVKFTMISDCCHSGSMLDHPEQQISGNKDPNAPPGVDSMNPMDLLGMFFKDLPAGLTHDQDKNRSLPQSMFCQLLGQKFGAAVMPGQIHSMLQRSFGNDASAKSLNYLGLLQQGLAAIQAIGGGTRDFPGEGGNANAGSSGTRAYGDQGNSYQGGNRASQGTGSMACFMMVVKALMKMKSKPSGKQRWVHGMQNQSGYGGGGGGGMGGMFGGSQQQHQQQQNTGYGGNSGYGGGGGGGGGWGNSQQQQQQQNTGYGGGSGYGGNTGGGGGGGGGMFGSLFGGSSQQQHPQQNSGYGGNQNAGGGGMWGAPQQPQQHQSSGYGGSSAGGMMGGGGMLGSLMSGLGGGGGATQQHQSSGYGGAQGGGQGGYGGQQGNRPSGPGGEARNAHGVLITGCQSHETSADACPSGDPSKAFGALTNALVTSVHAVKRNNPNATPSYKQLVQDVRSVMLHAKYQQNPCLECDTREVDSPFIC